MCSDVTRSGLMSSSEFWKDLSTFGTSRTTHAVTQHHISEDFNLTKLLICNRDNLRIFMGCVLSPTCACNRIQRM